MKRTLSICFILLLCLNFAVPAFAADTCIVAGFPELCGSSWQADDPNNAMTLNGGVFEKVYPNVPVGSYEFKTVYNGEWLPGDNLAFSVVTPCDVTITYDPATGVAGYAGPGIGKATVQVTDIYVAGTADDPASGWLNGESWNAAATANKAIYTVDGVYSLYMKDIPAGTYQFKFAADGTWDQNWGGSFTQFDTPTDAVSKGEDISFTLTEKHHVTLTLDLTGDSAKFTVTLDGQPPVPAPVPEHTENYYVAGEAALCGPNWEANTPANQMTKGADGLYAKTFANVAAGTYQLKVTDGTWDNCWGGDGPEGNYQFTTEAGDVTVKFDPATKQISVVLPKQPDPKPTDPTPTDPTPTERYFVAGEKALCGVEWEPNTSANEMKKGADGIYTKTFKKVAKGTYLLKVTDGTWDNCWGGSGPEGNYQFTTEAGDVTVKLDPATKQISVDLPGKSVDNGPKYYVSGNCKAMGDWNAAPAQCQMRLRSDGKYAIVFKQLPAGKYEFKVTDGTWNNSWGENGGNKKFELTKTQDVGIYFTLNNGQANIEVDYNPDTDDFILFPTVAAALCVTICGCLLLMNKKKLI